MARTAQAPDRLADLFSALAASRLAPKRMTFVHADSSVPPSMVLLESVKDGSTGLRVTPPLLLYRDGPDIIPRTYSAEAETVYSTCRLQY